MKEPEEYLEKVNALTTREKLYEIGAQIQKDAYNQALDDVQNHAKFNRTEKNGRNILSIFEIHRHLLLKLKK